MATAEKQEFKAAIERVRGSRPVRREMSLIEQNGSLTQTVMHQAVSAEGLTGGDTVEQIYLPEMNAIVIDLQTAEE